MNRPKDWWGDPKKAQEWIDQNKRREQGRRRTNTTIQSQEIIIDEVLSNIGKFKNILEVGAGDGRLIGNISKEFDVRCNSIDINPELSKYVKKNFPKVKTNVGEIINLPFKDNTFDLVFTYQVLQHVSPDEIERAINELQRVCKKELWMCEGIGRIDYEHGAKTHNAHNGSFVWHIDKMIDCYEVKVPQNKNVKLSRQRLYKWKKYD